MKTAVVVGAQGVIGRYIVEYYGSQTLCGFAPGTAMSILPVIAVYAAVIKELGRPLRLLAPFRAERIVS